MSKTVSMTIKLEPELRDEFAAEAARQHRTASQMLRELMWSVIENDGEPNAESIAAMDELDNGGGFHAKDADELFRQCGIPLP